MAYAVTNPPKLLVPSFTNVSGESSIWTYSSTDAATDVDVPGYFTNAKELGIKAGDVIFVTDSDASPVIITAHRAISYSGTTLTISTGNTFVTGTAGS
jgi:hypothetical protein